MLLVACRRQEIAQLTDTLERAGLEPVVVDVESFAVERAFGVVRRQLKDRSASDPEACVGLVDVGANINAFHVMRGDNIIYTRDTVFGGRRLTDAIGSRYDMSREEAGYAKKYGGLPDDYQAEVLDPFLDTIVQQVGRSLQLYYSAGRHHEVREIVLAGGTSLIPGLAERIAEDSGMRVTIANPFECMTVSRRIDLDALTRDAPAMLTACGLAMRAKG